jgi:hypothetical protein
MTKLLALPAPQDGFVRKSIYLSEKAVRDIGYCSKTLGCNQSQTVRTAMALLAERLQVEADTGGENVPDPE